MKNYRKVVLEYNALKQKLDRIIQDLTIDEVIVHKSDIELEDDESNIDEYMDEYEYGELDFIGHYDDARYEVKVISIHGGDVYAYNQSDGSTLTIELDQIGSTSAKVWLVWLIEEALKNQ